MHTQCNAEQLEFSCVERRRAVAAFDGGRVSSDAGALLIGRTDAALGLLDRLAGCFVRDPNLIEHSVRTLLGQRVFGMALGYEDLNDHERLCDLPINFLKCDQNSTGAHPDGASLRQATHPERHFP